MGFKVEKTVYVNKTSRLDTKLVDQLEQICIKKNISLNRLIVSVMIVAGLELTSTTSTPSSCRERQACVPA